MAEEKSNPVQMVISVALLIISIAVVALIDNFGDTGFSLTWPVVFIAIGLGLITFGFWELGLGVSGFFLILLLSKVEVIPGFSKSWPFTLIWIVVLVVIGFLRARSGSRKNTA